MTAIINDWDNYCENNAIFDKSHFLTLIHGDYSDQELAQIFRHFPCAGQLAANVKRFRTAWHHRSAQNVQLSESDVCTLAMADLREKSIAFDALGDIELRHIVENVTPLVIFSSSRFELAAAADWPNCEKQVVIGDYFDGRWRAIDHKMEALLEAFYGAANSYDIQWYLGSPLMETSVDFENYFMLWEAGYETALTNEHVLIKNMFQ